MRARTWPFIVTLALALGALGIFRACAPAPARAAERPVTFLAAASTKDAAEAIGKRFAAERGVRVRVVPGPSSGLAAQILAGAPAEVFLSANRAWAERVKAEGLALEMRPLLGNDLVLVVPRGNPAGVKGPAGLTGPRVKRVALAGERAPAGIYADQALQSLGLKERLARERKIVRGQDVRIALSYVERGEAEAGIVYATDAKISREVETVYVFPPGTYKDRIVYPALLLKGAEANPAARAFYEFLFSPAAARVFAEFGFIRIE